MLTNHAGTSHGLDSHALRTDVMHFGPVAPTMSMTIEKTVDTPSAYMYHCTSGSVTDLHIKSGLNVLVVDGKVFKLRNRDADLKTHAGHVATVTGNLSGDTIRVSKVDIPKGAKT